MGEKEMQFKRCVIGLVAGLALGVAMIGNRSVAAASKDADIQVVASVDFYGEAAQAVLGDHGQVTSIIDQPNVDPHDYEPTTKVGKRVAKADVAVYNGAGYDTWMTKLLKGKRHHTVKVSAAKVVGVKDGENEHIWYKPQTMPKMANALAKQFGKLDKVHKAEYQKNAQTYIASLKPLLTLIDKLKANAGDKSVAVSEPVFVNALTYLGYKVNDAHFANAIEEGSDPSPADIRKLDNAIKDKKIAFFVQNTQVESKIVDRVVKKCRTAGVPVLKVTETLPKGKDYTQWMTAQYQALEKIQTAEK
jgi:zinc/manganese transport system substrate-binding protein